MGKVIERELAWLARETPGFKLLCQPSENASRSQDYSSPEKADGPLRRIACRGSELFVAVGSELRWSETRLLKDKADERYEERRGRGSIHDDDEDGFFRILQTSVVRPITQIHVSPDGDYLAILTSHTCHVAVLPSSHLLHSGDFDPIRLKTFQIGPTVHVVEKSPVASALWHPLSAHGNCLVTVTRDACVRLWELDRDNRDSFGSAALAVDLRKLSNAETQQDNFSTSAWGTNVGFSPDVEEMQVAGACFGGQGYEDEHGWSSMTLWVAMTSGGVYALCPFLPSRWRAPVNTLPSLTTAVVAKTRAVGRAIGVTEKERRVVEQQTRWLADVDNQEPLSVPSQEGEFQPFEIYARPGKPGAIPKLQGPFDIDSEVEIGQITDICVIGPRIGDEALYDGDFEDLEADDGLSVGIICLAEKSGKVHVCLDLGNVEAEWLPNKASRSYGLNDDDDEANDLLLFETIDLSAKSEAKATVAPSFTTSPLDRYSLFSTQASGVYRLDFRPWVSRLEKELIDLAESGSEFRLNVLLESASTLVDRPVEVATSAPTNDINSAVAINAYDLGCILLSSAGGQTFSALLESPSALDLYAPEDAVPTGLLPAPEARAPYQPDALFFQTSRLPMLSKEASDKRVLGTDLKAPVRFSTATLQLLTDSHRLISKETADLEEAAAALFRRVERMRSELQEQVRKVRDVSQRVDSVLGEDEDLSNNEEAVGKEKIEMRIKESRERSERLHQRVGALQKRLRGMGGQPLSAQERAFANEIKTLAASINVDAQPAPTEPGALLKLENSNGSSNGHSDPSEHVLANRLSAASVLRGQLIKQVDELVSRAETNGSLESRGAQAMSNFRKQKMEEVYDLLERESALIEGVQARLQRLSHD